MRVVAFHQVAFVQYNEWAMTDKKVLGLRRALYDKSG